MKNRTAFTMIELIFVIVIMGIIGKFGTEFLAQAYKNFISVKIHNKYQNESMSAVEFIAKRLQYRIKNSVIERDAATGTFGLLEGAATSTNDVLEWVGYDVDGLRAGAWSGIYSKNGSGTELLSPESDTTDINTIIQALSINSASTTDIGNIALYIIGSDSGIDSWGWNGVATDLNASMKPVKAGGAADQFASDVVGETFDDIESIYKNTIYNSYQLAWSAYAVVFKSADNELWLYSDYQPWEGESYTAAQSQILIMEDVSDFKKKQTKGVITIKVCSQNPLGDLDEGAFLICEEKTVL